MIKPAVIVLTDEGEVIGDDRATGTKYIRKDRIPNMLKLLAELLEAAQSVVKQERIERQSKAISAVNVPPQLGRAIDALAALLPEEGK